MIPVQAPIQIVMQMIALLYLFRNKNRTRKWIRNIRYSWSALTGTYGQLTINADGSYTYVANQDAADALDSDGAYDYFTYTLSDGSATDTAEIKILVLGDDNDRPTATDGSVYINENNTDATHGTRTASNITYTFSSTGSEFNYSDAESDTFTKIRIKSLPSNGTLHRLDANGFITEHFR